MSDGTVTATAKPKRAKAGNVVVLKSAKKAPAKKAAPKKTTQQVAVGKFLDATQKAGEALTELTKQTSEATKTAKQFSKAAPEEFHRATIHKERRERVPSTVEELRTQTQGKGSVHRTAPHRPARLRYDARPAPRLSESDKSFPFGGFAFHSASKKTIACMNANDEIRYMRRVVADAKLASR